MSRFENYNLITLIISDTNIDVKTVGQISSNVIFIRLRPWSTVSSKSTNYLVLNENMEKERLKVVLLIVLRFILD